MIDEITKTIKTIALALFWGGISGYCGLAFSFFLPLNIAFIFGGLGMLIAYIIKIPLLLPAIHCVYAFFIIRFRLKGIIFVVVFHYSLTMISLIVWTKFNLSPDLWDGIRMFYDAYINPHPINNDPFYKILGPIYVMMFVAPSTLYNGILLSLLFSKKVRKAMRLQQ